ncbi:MAG: hypothetical protein FWD75_11245 [Propionibacteriaceae bacterium]|nr:hypothetical protein [Propionibacteriaceae bacterium]
MDSIELAANCSIFTTGDREVRIRKGIWNYEEAVLNLDGVSPDLQAAVSTMIQRIEKESSVAPEAVEHEFLTQADDISQFHDLVNALTAQRYLVDAGESVADRLISSLVGGSSLAYRLQTDASLMQPVLLITDNESTAAYCETLAKQSGLPLETMPIDLMRRLSQADLTTRFDGIDTRNEMDRQIAYLSAYQAVCVTLSTPWVSLLRNLNRVVVRTGHMVSYSILDGPFLTAFTIKPKETGCFECFENRILARIENLSIYKKFVEASNPLVEHRAQAEVTGLLNTFASLPLFEALLYGYTKHAKLAARVFNVFIPSLEVQVQDLLRMPSCPACGFLDESRIEEMYTSTKQIVDGLVRRVELTSQENQK